MANEATNKTMGSYTHKQKSGNTRSKAVVGKPNYQKNRDVNPSTTPASHYLHKESPNSKKSKAVVGDMPQSVVNKTRSNPTVTSGNMTHRKG